MNIKRQLLLIATALVMAGCATSPYHITLHAPPLVDAGLGRVPTVFLDRNTVIVPVIDAGIFNIAYETAKAGFKESETAWIPTIDGVLQSQLQTAGVAATALPVTIPEGMARSIPPLATATPNERDPATLSAFRAWVEKTCSEYQVKNLLLTFCVPSVNSVGIFGINGSVRIDTLILVVDAKGDFIARGLVNGPAVTIGGNDVKNYQKVLSGALGGQKELLRLMMAGPNAKPAP